MERNKKQKLSGKYIEIQDPLNPNIYHKIEHGFKYIGDDDKLDYENIVNTLTNLIEKDATRNSVKKERENTKVFVLYLYKTLLEQKNVDFVRSGPLMEGLVFELYKTELKGVNKIYSDVSIDEYITLGLQSVAEIEIVIGLISLTTGVSVKNYHKNKTTFFDTALDDETVVSFIKRYQVFFTKEYVNKMVVVKGTTPENILMNLSKYFYMNILSSRLYAALYKAGIDVSTKYTFKDYIFASSERVKGDFLVYAGSLLNLGDTGNHLTTLTNSSLAQIGSNRLSKHATMDLYETLNILRNRLMTVKKNSAGVLVFP